MRWIRNLFVDIYYIVGRVRLKKLGISGLCVLAFLCLFVFNVEIFVFLGLAEDTIMYKYSKDPYSAINRFMVGLVLSYITVLLTLLFFLVKNLLASPGEREMRATQFYVNHGVFLEDRDPMQILDRPSWVIIHGSNVMNKDGDWEWEPGPSSRDDDFFDRCRYTKEKAEELIKTHLTQVNSTRTK